MTIKSRLCYLFVLMLLALNGCTTFRPVGTDCAFETYAYPIQVSVESEDVNDGSSRLAAILEKASRVRDSGQPRPDNPLSWLILSGGGQWGAFGVGFLKGWSHSGTRPKFDVVAGVSTGALIAPYALLGETEDKRLIAAYQLKKESDLIKRRNLLSLLWSNSLYKSEGLSHQVYENLKQARAVSRLQIAQREGRKLLVGVVDADDGLFYAVDLTALADAPDMTDALKEVCMAHYMLAPSAIPVVLEPRFINGRMLVDGSARTSVFATDLTRIAKRYGANATDIYIIKNGIIRTVPRFTRNNMSHIARRSTEIVTDQLGDQALVELIRKTKAVGDVKVATADKAACDADAPELEKSNFNPNFMQCLIAEGRKQGENPKTRWNYGLERKILNAK